MKPKTPLPKTPAAWLDEIVAAWRDAGETIPFGALIGVDVTEENLFHLAPAVCLKFRGIEPSEANREQTTQAALTSYVANDGGSGDGALAYPRVAFAFCYLASHFGLDLLDEAAIREIMDYIADHLDTLEERPPPRPRTKRPKRPKRK